MMGSGTISGPTKSYGSMLELTWGGKSYQAK
jgi:hypothetical protein